MRWTTVDPLWLLFGAYQYVRCQPQALMDPLGLSPCDDDYDRCAHKAGKAEKECNFAVLAVGTPFVVLCGLAFVAGGVPGFVCSLLAIIVTLAMHQNCTDDHDRAMNKCFDERERCEERERACEPPVGFPQDPMKYKPRPPLSPPSPWLPLKNPPNPPPVPRGPQFGIDHAMYFW